MKYISVMRTHKEPVEAIRYTVDNLNEVIRFIGTERVRWNCLSEELWIDTQMGEILVREGAYVVKRKQDKTYPLPQRIFHRLYRRAEVLVSVESSEVVR